MNLTEWAQAQGIHVATVYRWHREGALKASGCAQRAIGPRGVLNAGSAPGGGGG